MKVTVTPTTVTIPVLKVKGNGSWQLIEQPKVVGVTINAVDAMSNLPITGYIYDKAPFSGTTFVGTSGSAFNYTFWSGGATMSPQQWYDYVAMNAAPSTAANAKGDYTAGRIEADEVRLE